MLIFVRLFFSSIGVKCNGPRCPARKKEPMLVLESYKQEAGKMEMGIVHYMKKCQQNLSNRAGRERLYLLLPKYKEKERE